ncbi:MAG TPA: lipoyl(octanoyl) transferase LipB [Thermoplasmata archaeon]|nr:lipoyl(octanoyl) transferase LipB [Thermoplasmata archaeon]
MPRVVDWGRREYVPALEEMRAMARDRRAGRIDDTLVLVEHSPVVTVGVEGDDGAAAASGLPVIAVERGGKATYHGPGQQVGYPIVDLDPRGRDVRRFVRDVEALVIRPLADLGIAAEHVPGRPGVWVDGRRKIASVGIAVDHWVTLHGFALNVDPDLAAFARFRPCGFDAAVMTSVARETGRPATLDAVRPGLLAAWAERFGGPAPPAPTVLPVADAPAARA